MVALVEVLLAKGLAYEQDGSFYFRVGAFPDYGKLSRLDPGQLRATERVEGDEYGKEEARDFALWKAAKEGEPAWDTALGRGRPGWHLECSALSMKYLGETFDLHLGGVDLIFPHHENEIAQSAGATGKALARYWLHCAHLIVDGTKMSKSLGNQYTLRDLTDAGHDPVAIRYLLASVHYRKRLNFTFAALEQAKAATARLAELVLRLEQVMDALPERSPAGEQTSKAVPAERSPAGEPPGKAAPAERSPVGEPHGKAAPAERSPVGEQHGKAATDEGPGSRALAAARRGFAAALADDLNTSGALGHVFSLVRAANTALDEDRLSRDEGAAILDWLRSIDTIWAVLPAADKLLERHLEIDGTRLVAIGPPIAEEAVEMVLARMRARAGRDFAAADRLRDRLQALGITLEDTAQGVRWHLGEPG
jgi:cysteinyl-tRNA synthetase